MPGPASTTATRAVPDPAASVTVTVVPGGVCVRALASRLVSTWVSRDGVAGHRDGLVGQVELPAVVRARGVGVAHGVEDEAGEVDVGALQRPSGVEAGEQEQVLDQRRHPLGLRGDARQGVRGVVRERPAAGQLGVAADRGERGAQLVAGVGDELAQLHLAVLPGLQRRADVVEHVVERRPDLADLGGAGRRPAPARRAPPRRGPAAGWLTRRAVAATRSSGSSARRTSTAPITPGDGQRDRGDDQLGRHEVGHRLLELGFGEAGDLHVAVETRWSRRPGTGRASAGRPSSDGTPGGTATTAAGRSAGRRGRCRRGCGPGRR